jgi:hypothetical protein
LHDDSLSQKMSMNVEVILQDLLNEVKQVIISSYSASEAAGEFYYRCDLDVSTGFNVNFTEISRTRPFIKTMTK